MQPQFTLMAGDPAAPAALRAYAVAAEGLEMDEDFVRSVYETIDQFKKWRRENGTTMATEGAPAPIITVLCGSTRFIDAFQEANLRLTVAGHVVLSIGCDTKSDKDLDLAAVAGDGRSLDQIKRDLDDLHKRKIDLADEVLVLNVNGYIGESTRSEIEYAHAIGKPVAYLEPLGSEV